MTFSCHSHRSCKYKAHTIQASQIITSRIFHSLCGAELEKLQCFWFSQLFVMRRDEIEGFAGWLWARMDACPGHCWLLPYICPDQYILTCLLLLDSQSRPIFFAKPCQNSTPLASQHNYVSFLHLTHLRQFTLQPHGVWAFSSAPVSLAGNAGPAAGSIHLHSFISQKYKKQVLLKDSNSVFGVTPWDTCKRQHIEVPRCGSCCYCCYQVSISPTFKGTMNVQNSVVGKPLA